MRANETSGAACRNSVWSVTRAKPGPHAGRELDRTRSSDPQPITQLPEQNLDVEYFQ